MTKRKSQGTRNRKETEARIIEAVGTLLARDGFGGFGVNAVAREAGVDKVLIYRYFDDLSGLVSAYGRQGNFWPDLEEFTGGDPEQFGSMPKAQQIVTVTKNLISGLRKRPLTQEILAWETVEENMLTKLMEESREKEHVKLGDYSRPLSSENPDEQAIAAIAGAAAIYIVLSARHNRYFAGIDLHQEEGWQRLEEAIKTMVENSFQEK